MRLCLCKCCVSVTIRFNKIQCLPVSTNCECKTREFLSNKTNWCARDIHTVRQCNYSHTSMQIILCSLAVFVCSTCAISLVADLKTEPKRASKKGEWTNITCKCGITEIPKKNIPIRLLSYSISSFPIGFFIRSLVCFKSTICVSTINHRITFHILKIGKILMHVAKFLTSLIHSLSLPLSHSLYCRLKINIISEMRQQKHQTEWVSKSNDPFNFAAKYFTSSFSFGHCQCIYVSFFSTSSGCTFCRQLIHAL